MGVVRLCRGRRFRRSHGRRSSRFRCRATSCRTRRFSPFSRRVGFYLWILPPGRPSLSVSVSVVRLVCLTPHLSLAHCCLRITQRPALVLSPAGPSCVITRQGQSSDTSSYSSRNSLVYSCKI